MGTGVRGTGGGREVHRGLRGWDGRSGVGTGVIGAGGGR